MYRKGLYTVA